MSFWENAFKGKTIIELDSVVERLPFYERKKKLCDSEERRWLLYPKHDAVELRPCNLPIHLVLVALSTYDINANDMLPVLRSMVRSSIGKMRTFEKGMPLFGQEHYENIRASHQLITDELIDSIIYCVAHCRRWPDAMLRIDHNLTWLFYGTTRTGDYYVDAKELYEELPRKTL